VKRLLISNYDQFYLFLTVYTFSIVDFFEILKKKNVPKASHSPFEPGRVFHGTSIRDTQSRPGTRRSK